MKKVLFLTLMSSPALAHTGHGAASLMHLHGVDLVAVALLVLVLGVAPRLLRARKDKTRR